MTDDGRTVAVPLTQKQAREIVRRRVRESVVIMLHRDECERIADAVLSAPPEVLAAAMGGELHLLNDAWVIAGPGAGGKRPCIVLPPRKVTRGEQ